MGSSVRDPAYADPPVPADWGSEVAQKNGTEACLLGRGKILCKICKGACVGDLLLWIKFNLGQGP